MNNLNLKELEQEDKLCVWATLKRLFIFICITQGTLLIVYLGEIVNNQMISTIGCMFFIGWVSYFLATMWEVTKENN